MPRGEMLALGIPGSSELHELESRDFHIHFVQSQSLFPYPTRVTSLCLDTRKHERSRQVSNVNQLLPLHPQRSIARAIIRQHVIRWRRCHGGAHQRQASIRREQSLLWLCCEPRPAIRA